LLAGVRQFILAGPEITVRGCIGFKIRLPRRPYAFTSFDPTSPQETIAMITRRSFVQSATAALGAAGLLTRLATAADEKAGPLYKISLAEWSLHKTIFGKKLDHLDFAKTAKEEFGIEAVEYVNQMFKDKAKDEKYLADMKQRAEDHGVKSLLIMIDGEGALGDADVAKRKQAVENHHRWVEAAKFLGCHSIRVNAQSSGTFEEQMERAADGLSTLSEFAGTHGLNVIVENQHAGLQPDDQPVGGGRGNYAPATGRVGAVAHQRLYHDLLGAVRLEREWRRAGLYPGNWIRAVSAADVHRAP
jgi:hypothetical protein